MYIPSSNIVETGYTQGYRFTSKIGENYKGFYFKDNKGKFYSGKSYTTDTIELIDTLPPISLDLNSLVRNNVFNSRYTKLYKNDLNVPLLKTEYIEPSEDDYINGVFVRCVAQLIPSIYPEKNIVEITSSTFYQVKNNPSILKLYRLASFGWKLNGPIDDVYKNNIRVRDGAVSTNLRSLADVEKKIKGISLYLDNPLQFVNVSIRDDNRFNS